MKIIRVGLIGAGFMGNMHALALSNVQKIFGDNVKPELVLVADVNEAAAKNLAEKYGFQKWTTDWKEVIECDDIDLVHVTTTNSSHVEISIAAIKKGKHVYCEKPLGMDGKEAFEAVKAAEEMNVITQVGFNYIKNPAILYAKQLIDSKELGEIISFKGTYDQDFYAEEEHPHVWRFLKSASASGALGDLATHTISLSQYLVGETEEVCGMSKIVFETREQEENASVKMPVENDDVIFFIYKIRGGAIGTITSSRVAHGKKQGLTFTIQLTKGAISYDQERLNELQIYRSEDIEAERGYKTILIGPEHPNYKYFFGGAGIGLGYMDVKTIEAHEMLKGIEENRKLDIDFRFGWKVNRIVDAVLESDEKKMWVKIED